MSVRVACSDAKLAAALSSGYASATASTRCNALPRGSSSRARVAGPRLRRLHRAPARRDDCFERAAFVARVALHDRDDVGNEIMPAFELHVDVGPGVLAEPSQVNKPVERVHGPHQTQQADE